MHAVPLDAPIKLFETYGCHYVGYYLAGSEDTRTWQEPNALTILMQNAERLVLLVIFHLRKYMEKSHLTKTVPHLKLH